MSFKCTASGAGIASQEATIRALTAAHGREATPTRPGLLKLIEPREHSHEPLSQDAPLQSSDALHRFRRGVLLGVSVAVVVALEWIFVAFVLHRG